MKYTRKISILCLFSILLISFDRISKSIAKEHLQTTGAKSYFHDTLRLEYVENTGAFLSLGADWSSTLSFWIFSVIPLIFLSLLFIYAIKESRHPGYLKVCTLLLIFSGGIGNIIDRLLFNRHVSDFINIGINDFRTGIFNFADLYVTAGVIIYLITNFKPKRNLISSEIIA